VYAYVVVGVGLLLALAFALAFLLHRRNALTRLVVAPTRPHPHPHESVSTAQPGMQFAPMLHLNPLYHGATHGLALQETRQHDSASSTDEQPAYTPMDQSLYQPYNGRGSSVPSYSLYNEPRNLLFSAPFEEHGSSTDQPHP
jgi:hypothetical protein